MTVHYRFLRSLVRAPVTYTGWDADAIQGCVCDLGYTGYDCSKRTCPFGMNPLSKDVKRSQSYNFVCQASVGYFNIQLLGKITCLMSYQI